MKRSLFRIGWSAAGDTSLSGVLHKSSVNSISAPAGVEEMPAQNVSGLRLMRARRSELVTLIGLFCPEADFEIVAATVDIPVCPHYLRAGSFVSNLYRPCTFQGNHA